MSRYIDERREVVAAAGRCREQKLQTGNGGNISLRVGDGSLMAVKATNASFADSSISAVVVTDLSGAVVDGDRRPSKESLLHGSIYARRADIHAIVHCHSPWANGWSTTGRALPSATYHSELKLGGYVPVVDTGGYSVPAELLDTVMEAFDGPPAVNAVILARHGLVALGKDMNEALELAELVEETAHVAVIERLLG